MDEVSSQRDSLSPTTHLAGITRNVSNPSGMPGTRPSDITTVRLFSWVESATC